MSYQNFFNYQFALKKDTENYFVNKTNQKAYDITILEEFNQNIFLFGPKKSGKSHLVSIWKGKNNAILFNNNNFNKIIETTYNVVVDDCLNVSSEENIFHLIFKLMLITIIFGLFNFN